MSASTKIFLVRHGETDANKQRPRVLAGRGDDSPLNDTGRAQAAWAADQLAGCKLSAVYSSPLQRAMETAGIIAAPHGLDVIADQDLAETDCGRWEHKSWEWIEENDHEAYDNWMQRADIHPYPEGETFTEACERFRAAVERLCVPHQGQTILITAHNTVIKTFLARCLELPLQYARKVPHSNAGISCLEYRGEKGFKLRMINASVKYLR